MKSVIYGQNERFVRWFEEQVPDSEFDKSAVAIGLEQDGEVIASVVFDMYTGPSICMHVAAVPGRRWMTRDYLWRCFAYPFLQLKCNRITGLVREDNLVAQKFDEHLGFKREGLIRRGATDGTNIILYGMLRDECRFLEMKR
jgi:RimJ/RimL family protein N-acetyltransferase